MGREWKKQRTFDDEKAADDFVSKVSTLQLNDNGDQRIRVGIAVGNKVMANHDDGSKRSDVDGNDDVDDDDDCCRK